MKRQASLGQKAGLCIMLIAMISLSGCWDMREINELGLVMAVGIDKSVNNPNEYLLTVQIANTQMGSSTGDSNKTQQDVWVASAEGKTIFEAIREIARFSSQRIMWAHNNVIIVGESLAQDDISPVIDFFSHNHELRMKTWIAVAQGNASDFLAANAGMGSIPGQSMGDVFRYQQITGLGLPSNLLEVYRDFTSENKDFLITSLSFNQAITEAGLSQRTENTEAQIEIAGMAVFKQNRMLGYLTVDETRGLSWVLSHNTNRVISVDHPENSTKSVAVEIKNVKVKVDSQLDQDTPGFTIKISGTGEIAEEDTFSGLSISQFKDQVEAKLEQQIVKEVQLGLNKVQKEYKSDVLGFGAIVHAQHKQAWNGELKNRWTDIYPDVEVKVEAHITIESSTLNEIPLRDNKENSNTYD
ncbi:MAG: Ger(x)C family spore germination protein [Syntrophomonadaceae bacterium]|nr:Ger(x)C family spore germination protein [Syntrophomonadaceae bacterium]